MSGQVVAIQSERNGRRKPESLARLKQAARKLFVERGYDEAIRVLSSHAATRDWVVPSVVDGLACPVTPRDFVSIRLDPAACIGCGLCEAVCETEAFIARGKTATVRKLSNYECSRDHACARNCPTGAIRLGNL